MELKDSTKLLLIEYLKGFVSENRLKRFDEVLSHRTDHLRIVLEDVFQSHNASAVLRSCDCFGVQNVHFIENRNNYKVNEEVSMGSASWLSIHRHKNEADNTRSTLEQLKGLGYRIVATTPHRNDHAIKTLPIKEKTALIFGTEQFGISQTVIDMADDFVKIPMYGFTESFNISVSAALCLYELTERIRAEIPNHGIGEKEHTDIYLKWLINSIDTGELLVERFLKENGLQ